MSVSVSAAGDGSGGAWSCVSSSSLESSLESPAVGGPHGADATDAASADDCDAASDAASADDCDAASDAASADDCDAPTEEDACDALRAASEAADGRGGLVVLRLAPSDGGVGFESGRATLERAPRPSFLDDGATFGLAPLKG